MRIFKILAFFVLASLLYGCTDPEILETVKEKEVFVRHQNSHFNYNSVNIQAIQTIGNRLFFSHRTNPGYIENTGEVVQLCCYAETNQEQRQSFSEKYIISAAGNLKYFLVYVTDKSKWGYINFYKLDVHADKQVSIHSGIESKKFAVNGNYLIASMREDNLGKIFIYNVDLHTNFYGQETKDGVIELDFSQFLDPNSAQGARIHLVENFKEGWILSVAFNQQMKSGTFLVQKDGTIEKLDFKYDGLAMYNGHTTMDNGQIFMMINRHLFVSRTGLLKDLKMLANTNNYLQIASVDNRLIIYHPAFHIMSEVEDILEDKEEYSLRRLDDTNLTFSSINGIQSLGEDVYVATSLGLFTKSRKGLWDSYEEPETDVASGWIEEIQWAK